MVRQVLTRSRETRSNKTLKVSKQKSKVESNSKLTGNSHLIKKTSPKNEKKRSKGTNITESEKNKANISLSTLNGSTIVKLRDKGKAIKTANQSDKKIKNGKPNAVRNRKGTKPKEEIEIVDKTSEDNSKSAKSSGPKQKAAKNVKGGSRKTEDSKSARTSRTNNKASPVKSRIRRKSEKKELKNLPESKVVGKSEVEKKTSTHRSTSAKTVRTATKEASKVVDNGVKLKSEGRRRKRSALKPLAKDSAKKQVVAREVVDKNSADKGKSEPEIEKSSIVDEAEANSDSEEAVMRSPPKRKSKTNVLETLEKSSIKKPVNEIKNKIENKKAPKRKQNENELTASTDSPMKLGVVTNDTQQVDVRLEPSAKKIKTSSSVDRKKKVSKKVSDPSDEDPYDFEAYLSTITPGKRKKALGTKRGEKLDGAEKPKAAQKRVWGRRPPQRTPWGGVAIRGGTPSHKFFIQPSRPKKKPQSDHTEEPSPSIAEEIVEFTLQPPFVPIDDDEEPGRPLGICSSSMIVSTPRADLTAAPLLRPMGASVISPISAPCEDSAEVSAAPQGKSSHPNGPTTEQGEPAAVKTNKPENPSHPEPEELGKQKSDIQKAQKAATKEAKEKDEFEAWLEKFSRELSDIESFELSVERS